MRQVLTKAVESATSDSVRDYFREMNKDLPASRYIVDQWRKNRGIAAVLLPIIERPAGLSILLTVRSSHVRSHAGQIALPGGKVDEDDEDIVATALREAREEVNIKPGDVDIIGSMAAHKGGRGFTVTPVVGLIKNVGNFNANPDEVAEIFEVPLSFVLDLNNHVVQQREDSGVKYNIFAMPYLHYDIWGLTSGILRTFAASVHSQCESI